MRLQLLERHAAGRHGQRFGADRPGALDVPRGVADDENLLAAQIVVEQSAAAFLCEGGDLIAVLVVVAKRAGSEYFPKFKVSQLDFGAEPDVASQQAERGRFGQRVQLADEFPDAGQHAAAVLSQEAVEPENVAIEEKAEIFRRRFDLVLQKKLARQPGIGAAGEFQPFSAVGDVELRGKRAAVCCPVSGSSFASCTRCPNRLRWAC